MPLKLKIDHVPIDQLKANDYNVNVVTPENEEKIRESIRRFDLFKPILVRTLEDGTKEIIGGEHRWKVAKDMGYTDIDVIDLGKVDDVKAKQMALIDNGRYGIDDNYKLSELISELGSIEDLSAFMPYSDKSLEELFANADLDLDSLDLDEDEITERSAKPTKPLVTNVIMRFKVPVGDSDMVQKFFERIMEEQNFKSQDSLQNAGDALVFVCNHYV